MISANKAVVLCEEIPLRVIRVVQALQSVVDLGLDVREDAVQLDDSVLQRSDLFGSGRHCCLNDASNESVDNARAKTFVKHKSVNLCALLWLSKPPNK